MKQISNQENKRRCKYIFICGAIASGIGKGVTNSSIGLLIKQFGYSVSFLKIDPYLNIDAGLMNPHEHGEVFVTDDGGEVDLDLGNYERFIWMNLTSRHSLTTGKLKERTGEYLGKTVQIIPHVVDEIKSWIRSISNIRVDDDSEQLPEVVLVEVGGTVGDLESTYYYEALRQMFMEEGPDNVALIMLTYIIQLGDEQKTKPAQNGLKDLRYTGLQADFLVCRSTNPLTQSAKNKLALFGSLDQENVFSVPDAKNIYEVPQILENQRFVEKMLNKLKLPIFKIPDMSLYKQFLDFNQELFLKKPTRIGVFGKYMDNKDAYMSLYKALQEAAYECEINLEIISVDLVKLEKDNQAITQQVNNVDAVLVPGGFGERGFEEKIFICKLAREQKKPFLGICYGFQAAVIEYARHLGHDRAQSEEKENQDDWTKLKNENYFVIYMPEIDINIKGGTMRLGSRVTNIEDQNSLAYKIYGKNQISERHRHRFEVNPSKISIIEEGGGRFTGRDQNRMEIFELSEEVHPFYLAVQYHPEFTSKNFKPNPLFVYFIKAAINKKPNGIQIMQRKWSLSQINKNI